MYPPVKHGWQWNIHHFFYRKYIGSIGAHFPASYVSLPQCNPSHSLSQSNSMQLPMKQTIVKQKSIRPCKPFQKCFKCMKCMCIYITLYYIILYYIILYYIILYYIVYIILYYIILYYIILYYIILYCLYYIILYYIILYYIILYYIILNIHINIY